MMAKTKTLVISSDPLMLGFLQQNLSRDEYELTCTRHTEDELKALLDTEYPDLIILDIMMPSLDGLEVCLRIRRWSPAPIMMLSAWGAGEGNIRGLDLRSDSYLTEPFGIEETKAQIRSALGHNLVAGFMSGIRSGKP